MTLGCSDFHIGVIGAGIPMDLRGFNMIGKVKRIVRDKGFGFIQGTDNVEYFFHKSACKNIDFEELKEGREVTFEDSEGQKGPRAEDVYV